MKTAPDICRKLPAVLALGLLCACSVPAAEPPAAAPAEDDYGFAKALVDIRWYDLAERVVAKSPDRAGAMLVRAVLARGRAESEATALNRLKLCDEAAVRLEEFRALDRDRRHPLAGEADALEAIVKQAQAQALEDVLADRTLAISPEDRARHTERLGTIRSETAKGLEKAMRDREPACEAAWAASQKDPENAALKKAEQDAFREYAMATQRYLNLMLATADRQAAGGDAQKKTGGELVKAVDDWLRKENARRNVEEEYLDLQRFMDYAKGRGLIYTGDFKAGGDLLDKVIATEVATPDQRVENYFLGLRTAAGYYKLRMLVAAAEKSGAREDWELALAAVRPEMLSSLPGVDPTLRVRSRILQGRCSGKIGRTAPALGVLFEAAADAERSGRSWLTSEVYEEIARQLAGRSVPLEILTPEALVQAGWNNYQEARQLQSGEKAKEAEAKFEDAIRCFRDATIRARMPDMANDWARRLKSQGEAEAWLRLGNTYVQMGRYLEAQLAYEGGLQTFWGQDGKALPEAVRSDPGLRRLLEQLRVSVLALCADNGSSAANSEYLQAPSAFGDQRREQWIKWQEVVDSPGARRRELTKGKRRLEAARRDAEQAGSLADAYAAALKAYGEAEDLFLAVPRSSSDYEEGLFYASVCCYEASNLIGRLGRSDADRAKSGEFSTRALKHFAKFESWVKDNPPRVDATEPALADRERQAIADRREQRLVAIKLMRAQILVQQKKFDEALADAESLLGRREPNLGMQEELHRILFRSRLGCAAAAGAAGLEARLAFLDGAGKDAEWFKERAKQTSGQDAERLRRRYFGCAENLAAAYGSLADQAPAAGAGEARRTALLKSAQWAEVALDDPPGQLIDNYYRVAKAWGSLGDLDRAARAYRQLTDKFDPQAKGGAKSDAELKAFLDAAVKAVRGQNVEAIVAAKAKLEEIRIAALGVEAEEQDDEGKPVKRIARRNYHAAATGIDRFLKEHADYDLDRESRRPGEGRRGLESVAEEMVLRQKLLAVWQDAAAMAAELGDGALKGGQKDKAAKLFQDALVGVNLALAFWPDDRELLLLKARCLVRAEAAASVEEAVKISAALRRRLEGDPRQMGSWFKATRSCVEGLIKLARYQEARGIIQRVWLNISEENRRKHWPELDEVIDDLAVNRMKLGPNPATARPIFLGENK
jgi:hypothetical protein